MMSNMNRTMQEAMRLMQTGNLHAATEAIQRGLRQGAEQGSGNSGTRVSDAMGDCIEGRYRVVPDSRGNDMKMPGTAETPGHEWNGRPGGEFTDRCFTCDAGAMRYKLFIPGGLDAATPPLIVMLHGCTQSPDDFARGTRMNALAQEYGYVVAYPAQSKIKNANKCWNWFRNDDQKRGQGEPAIIAALTRQLVISHGLDERRVYAAGLSAGGAMAAVLASTYPDVFAAIGVHSGLPVGVAHDLPSAFAAMKQGSAVPAAGVSRTPTGSVPVIVFHGDRDTTVDLCNGVAIIVQCIGATAEACEAQPNGTRATVERASVPGGRDYTRTIFRNADGSVAAEQWVIHGGGHAWFGGDRRGSYTDPSGPDASENMLRFFSACARSAIN